MNIALLSDLVAKRGGQIHAAEAWGQSQGHLSRILAGDKPLSRPIANRIASIEGIPVEQLWTQLEKVAHAEGPATKRFAYELDDPSSMLLQVENWFADVQIPTMHQALVRAVLRTLLDQSFDRVIHRPTPEWRIVMDRTEGWAPVAL